MAWARKKFHDWPEDATALTTERVAELYANGFAGATYSADAVAEFNAAMLQPDGVHVCHSSGMAESGAGKLVIPFVHVLEMFPGCWPGAQGQARGDCVSWGARNAALMTMVCDIVSGQPDEKSGKPEEKPDVPAGGISDGVLSTEAFYWWRGYNGDGWQCPSVAKVACQKSGLVLRKNYPEFGVDLTRYSGSTAGKYGSRAPGDDVVKVVTQHLIHQATNASNYEARRDLLHNGYGLIDCGGEGWSSSRDEYGMSKRSGSWSHSMSEIGFDDRDSTKQKFGEPLVCILNSWAKWNSGPRDIFQSAALVPPEKKAAWAAAGITNPATGNIMIPEGSFWTLASTCNRREVYAFSGAHGWPKKQVDPLDWVM